MPSSFSSSSSHFSHSHIFILIFFIYIFSSSHMHIRNRNAIDVILQQSSSSSLAVSLLLYVHILRSINIPSALIFLVIFFSISFEIKWTAVYVKGEREKVVLSVNPKLLEVGSSERGAHSRHNFMSGKVNFYYYVYIIYIKLCGKCEMEQGKSRSEQKKRKESQVSCFSKVYRVDHKRSVFPFSTFFFLVCCVSIQSN